MDIVNNKTNKTSETVKIKELPKVIILGKNDPDYNITKDFNTKEFRCSASNELKLETKLVYALQELRDLLGKPIKITSGYRHPTLHPIEAAKTKMGKPVGQHAHGKAVDFCVNGVKTSDLLKYVLKIKDFEKGGVGLARNYIHCDVRDTGSARWGYNGSNKEISWFDALKLWQ